MWQTLRSLIRGTSQQPDVAPASERRVWVRRSCDFPAYYQSPSLDFDDKQAGRVSNISRGGISVIVAQPIEAGAQLSVELPGDETRPAFTVLACVVHAAPQANGEWVLGCSFAQELRDEDLQPFGARRARTEPLDQRAWERFPCRVEASFTLLRAPEAGSREATVVNISANGVGLLVNAQVEVGAVLTLRLHRTGERSDLEILACVVRVTAPDEGQWLLGCNFISELTDTQMEALL